VGIRVRVGTRDDIQAIVDVNCSEVEQWHHFSSKGQGDPASYDELISLERCMHGGPWMDPTALAKYWETIERLGIIPLVAETDGRIVGHLDVIISDELSLGHFIYLDILMVHRAYRRRGVASALIKEAERLAISRKVRFMCVEPEQYEGPPGLTYRSCDFEKAFDTYHLETSVDHPEIPSGVQVVSIPQIQSVPIRTHIMMCGWYNISVKMWNFGINPDLESSRAFCYHDLALSALTSESIYFFYLQQKRFDHSTGRLCLWAPTPLNQEELQDIIQVSKAVASWLGIKTLTTKTIERYLPTLEKAGFKINSKGEPFLIKNVSQ